MKKINQSGNLRSVVAKIKGRDISQDPAMLKLKEVFETMSEREKDRTTDYLEAEAMNRVSTSSSQGKTGYQDTAGTAPQHPTRMDLINLERAETESQPCHILHFPHKAPYGPQNAPTRNKKRGM